MSVMPLCWFLWTTVDQRSRWHPKYRFRIVLKFFFLSSAGKIWYSSSWGEAAEGEAYWWRHAAGLRPVQAGLRGRRQHRWDSMSHAMTTGFTSICGNCIIMVMLVFIAFPKVLLGKSCYLVTRLGSYHFGLTRPGPLYFHRKKLHV